MRIDENRFIGCIKKVMTDYLRKTGTTGVMTKYLYYSYTTYPICRY